MTRDRAKQLCGLMPIIKAYAEGKTIQARTHLGDTWDDQFAPEFSCDDIEYRIKPEPREWYLAVDRVNGAVAGASPKPFDYRHMNCEVIHVKEVL